MKQTSQPPSVLRSTLAIVLTVMSSASSAQANVKVDPLPIVSDAWVKSTVPGGNVSAAYLRIHSRTSLRLVKVASPVAGIIEIHDMKMNDGVMEMKALDAIDVPAGKSVELKPGGMHIMLMKVEKPINKGDKVPLVLTFEGAGKNPLVVTLEAIAQENSSIGHKH